MNAVVLEGLRACFVSVALCAGIRHPGPTPRVHVLPNEPHTSAAGRANAPGFWCGTYADDTPAYCAGLTDTDGTIYVSTQTLQAIPHEMIHTLTKRKRLSPDPQEDPWDGAHEGRFWACDRLCPGLWP